MLGDVKSVRVALDNFYGDLSDEPKARFDGIGQSHMAECSGSGLGIASSDSSDLTDGVSHAYR
jgi:hypothetical protein